MFLLLVKTRSRARQRIFGKSGGMITSARLEHNPFRETMKSGGYKYFCRAGRGYAIGDSRMGAKRNPEKNAILLSKNYGVGKRLTVVLLSSGS
jgi:hypothetical protein